MDVPNCSTTPKPKKDLFINVSYDLNDRRKNNYATIRNGQIVIGGKTEKTIEGLKRDLFNTQVDTKNTDISIEANSKALNTAYDFRMYPVTPYETNGR